MDALLALGPIAAAAAGPAAAFGLSHAASALRPVTRLADVRTPWVLSAAAVWASFAPAGLVALSEALQLLPAVAFIWGGLAIALMDLSALRVPRIVSAAFAAAGLAFAALWAPDRLPAAALAGSGALMLLLGARLAFRKARGRDGLGGGDPGVMAALAVWLGPTAAPWALGLGAMLALGLAVRSRKDQPIPLATCLVAASLPVAAFSAWAWNSPFWPAGAL